MRVTLKNLVVPGLMAALCACAGGSGDYPSLALRPFETGAASMAPVPAPEPIRSPVSPERVAQLQARAAESHAAFLQQQSATARIASAARGQSIESNARAAALVAMADLDAQRGATAGALAELDALAAEAAAALAADPALAAAQGEVAALVARQDEAITSLWETIGS